MRRVTWRPSRKAIACAALFNTCCVLVVLAIGTIIMGAR